MILYTTDLPGDEQVAETLGLVTGSSVRGLHAGGDLIAAMKNKLGGEIEEYTKLLAEAREQALDRLRVQAESLGANAVVGLRFASTEIADGAAELLVYGTAVRLVRAPE